MRRTLLCQGYDIWRLAEVNFLLIFFNEAFIFPSDRV
jgi:hypothetical protein